MLSFVQFEDTLSGFQLCWYMVLAALAVVLFLLDRLHLGWLAFAGAIVVAAIGSYSAFPGLLIWPVGLILLLQRARLRAYVSSWIGAGGVTAALFFYHLNVSANGAAAVSTGGSLSHPLITMKFFFLALGDVVGSRLPVPNPVGGPYASRSVNDAVLMLGIGIFRARCVGCYPPWIETRRDETGPRPTGITLIVFGLLFAASTAFERGSSVGAWYAGTSRYTTFDLLVLIGSYLTLVDRRFSWSANRGWQLVNAGVVAVICLQFVLGLSSGIVGGEQTHRTGLETERVIVNIQHEPDGVVERIYFGPSIHFVRRMAKVAMKYRLTFLDSEPIPRSP